MNVDVFVEHTTANEQVASFQATHLLKFREAPLVKESLASLEKAVPSPTEEDEPDAGRNKMTFFGSIQCNTGRQTQFPFPILWDLWN